jgi:hypothetical protein
MYAMLAPMQVRDEEIRLMNKSAIVKTANLCLVFAVPPVIALVIYATYVYNVQPLDATLSFTILSLFNTLRFPLVVLPKALRGTSGGCGLTSACAWHACSLFLLVAAACMASIALDHLLTLRLLLCAAFSEALASMARLQQFLLIEEAPDAEKSKVVEAVFVSWAGRA